MTGVGIRHVREGIHSVSTLSENIAFTMRQRNNRVFNFAILVYQFVSGFCVSKDSSWRRTSVRHGRSMAGTKVPGLSLVLK
jgi:hypothetical protein